MDVNATELERQFATLSVGLNSFVFQAIGSMAEQIKGRDEYIKQLETKINDLHREIDKLTNLNAPEPNPLNEK